MRRFIPGRPNLHFLIFVVLLLLFLPGLPKDVLFARTPAADGSIDLQFGEDDSGDDGFQWNEEELPLAHPPTPVLPTLDPAVTSQSTAPDEFESPRDAFPPPETLPAQDLPAAPPEPVDEDSATETPGETVPATLPGPPPEPEETPLEPIVAATASTEWHSRPFAVMVENEPPARPQSGLWRAAVVYEIVAEEITRFMPIYLDASDETVIGPVRSARDYFADLSTIYDAIYVHCGGSPQGLSFIHQTPVDNIDAIRGDRGFYRTKDRRIPHNLYIRLSSLPLEADRKKYRRETPLSCPFLFRDTAEIFPERPGEMTDGVQLITIPYYRHYQVGWRWRPAEGVYRREYAGREFLSHDGAHPHDSENLIIQRLKTRIIDKQMRHEMDLYAGGNCEVFFGGRCFPGRWERRQDGRMVYRDLAGEEFRFNPGRIWIQFVEPELRLIWGELPADKDRGTRKR